MGDITTDRIAALQEAAMVMRREAESLRAVGLKIHADIFDQFAVNMEALSGPPTEVTDDL